LAPESSVAFSRARIQRGKDRPERDKIEGAFNFRHLALIDGDIGQFETAQKVAELALRSSAQSMRSSRMLEFFLVKPFTNIRQKIFRALVSTNLARLHLHRTNSRSSKCRRKKAVEALLASRSAGRINPSPVCQLPFQ